MNEWNEERLQSLIDDGIEESEGLDYKAADALGRSDSYKNEITKDISALANSAGGLIIYGIKEYDDAGRKHLPEKIDPIDRKKFSREWLEHIAGNTAPRIEGLKIYPIGLSTGPNDTAYVVEVPQGTTAHQASSLRYYRRYNFESVAMKDHEIRDVMNRATVPDADVEFSYKDFSISSHQHQYTLVVIIKNLCAQVINHFQLEFTFPKGINLPYTFSRRGNIDFWPNENKETVIQYRSQTVLFPHQHHDVGRELAWRYEVDTNSYATIRAAELQGEPLRINWTLYADNMPTKHGIIPFKQLHKF